MDQINRIGRRMVVIAALGRGMLKRGFAVHNIVLVAAILAIFCAALGFVLVQGARHPMVQ